MNRWSEIKEQIYTLVASMTIANGYNYDWVDYRRFDMFEIESYNGKACISLHYPEEAPFETRVSDDVPTSQNYEAYMRDFDLKCRVISDAVEVDEETIIDLNNDALDKALWDVKKAFNLNNLNNCNLRIRAVDMITAEKEEITSNTAYFPFLLSVNFNLIYEEKRGYLL